MRINQPGKSYEDKDTFCALKRRILFIIKIFINARFCSQPVTGVQRYAHELVKALDILISKKSIDTNKYSFIMLAPRNIKIIPKLTNIPLNIVGCFRGVLWEQLELPFFSKSGLLINLCNTAPLIKTNSIVTIHDAAVCGVPNAYSKKYKMWYKFLEPILGRRVKKVITDSNFSKNEITDYYAIPSDKIDVVYLGKDHICNIKSDNKILDKYALRGKNYILAVSSASFNKNFHSIAKAAKLLKHEKYKFVIVGGNNSTIFNKYEESFSSEVVRLGYITDSELKALYENASCFVYPSFYEGFGLPPIEAMACGCPVIVSNSASLPEICGDAALYCDPYNVQDIASKIKILMDNVILQEKLKRKGAERVEGYKWERCANKVLSLIMETCAGEN